MISRKDAAKLLGVAQRDLDRAVQEQHRKHTPKDRALVAAVQARLLDLGFDAAPVDGLWGPQTQYAWDLFSGAEELGWRDRAERHPALHAPPSPFPREQDARLYYGEPGTSQASLRLPYPMRLAWDTKRTVRRISIHERLVDGAARVLARVLDHYGREGIQEHGLDLFGGCLNVRKKRGGTQWSTHSWGAAIDFDPERNRLRWGRDRAHLATPECARFLDLWEEEGWVSLGRARNFDWMHVQALQP